MGSRIRGSDGHSSLPAVRVTWLLHTGALSLRARGLGTFSVLSFIYLEFCFTLFCFMRELKYK